MALTKISTDGVKDDAITKAKIPANQIEASELADNAVDTNAIANNAVTAGKLASGVQTTINNNADNRVITGSGTANTLNGESNLTFSSSLLVSDGNGSSNLGGNYLLLKRTSGTTNYLNAPLADGELYISADEAIRFATVHTADFNSTERMRIDSSGRVIIGSTSSIGNTYTNNFTVSEAAGNAGIQIEGNNSNSNYGSIYLGDAGARQRCFLEAQLGSNGNFTIGTVGSGPIRFTNSGGERMRIQSGGGISFNGDTAAANALDDYEEGTCDPTQVNGSFSASDTGGRYTKIGRICTWVISITFDSTASNNHLHIGNFPFTAGSGRAGAGFVRYSNDNEAYKLAFHVNAGEARAGVYYTDGGSIVPSNAVSQKRFDIVFVYETT